MTTSAEIAAVTKFAIIVFVTPLAYFKRMKMIASINLLPVWLSR